MNMPPPISTRGSAASITDTKLAAEDRADQVLDDDATPNAAMNTVKNEPSWRWIGR